MKHIFDIAMKDIRQTLRDKMTFIFLLGMPILFTVMFSFAFGGNNTSKVDSLPAVGFQDLDGSIASQTLERFLADQGTVRLEKTTGDSADLEKMVVDESLAAVVTVPAGYGQAMQSGQVLQLEVILDTTNLNGVTAQGAIQNAAARTVSTTGAALAASGTHAADFAADFATAEDAWSSPALRLETIGMTAEESSVESESLLSITHTAPAMMIQFSLAGLLTAAQVMVHERKTRCMQRLLTTRVARHEILLGHFLAIFIVILGQFLLLTGFGQLILGLDYLRLPLAALVMMISTAMFVASVGLLVGSLARTDQQATIFAMAPMFILSGLGGAWLPLEATGETFRSIGQYTPVAVALDGFKNIIARGLDFNTVLLPAAALTGYALVCFGLAVWKFKFE